MHTYTLIYTDTHIHTEASCLYYGWTPGCLFSPHLRIAVAASSLPTLCTLSGTPGLVAVDGDREVKAEIKEWISNHPIGPLRVSTCGMNGFITDLASVYRVGSFLIFAPK